MYLSSLLKGGTILQGAAGNAAINARDLVQMTRFGQLASVKVSDYAAVANAGAAVVASTTYGVSANTSALNGQLVDLALVNPADGSIFIVDTIGTTLSDLVLKKYTALGVLVASVTVDGSAGAFNWPQIRMLSNGNILVGYGYGTNINFSIIDQNLNIVVAPTSIGTTGANPGPFPYFLALTGGGFAASWTKPATGVYFAVYSNAGAVVSAAALVAGVPAQTSGTAAGAYTKLANLSNGNIAMALCDTNVSTLAHAIFTATGAPVLAYTALNTALAAGAGGSPGTPEIAVVNGFYCVATGVWGDFGTVAAYVLNNAGAVQGAPYTVSVTNSGMKLTTDGTYFWASFWAGGQDTTLTRLPTTGTGYVTSTWPGISVQIISLLWDEGVLICSTGTAVYAVDPTSAGVAVPSSNTAISGADFIAVGDFSLLWVGSGNFGITKYLDTAIVGVASQSVAAGNPGALVAYGHGGGSGRNGYPINPIMGSVGKAFDHSASNIVGNKGTMLGAGVCLEGII